MVKLVVDDFEQMTILEDALLRAKINYNIATEDRNYGLSPPYLVVNGVPLEIGHAMRWINDKKQNTMR